MTKAATISGILFDTDGTLLDYARSWVPVNYELARIAAAGDETLARTLLLAGGMDPLGWKAFNLVVHLLNGILLFVLLRRLLALGGFADAYRRDLAAVIRRPP